MELIYKTFGEGPPVLMLHGLFGSSDNWLPTAQFLKDTHTCFLPDLRNHGRSPHDSFMNYISMGEDILAFMNKHIPGKPFLIGHSMGGKLAMQLAVEHENLFSGLIVIDIANRTYPLRHIHYLQVMLGLNFDQIRSRHEAAMSLRKDLADEKLVQLLLKNLEWKSGKRLGWRINLEAIYEHIDDLMEGVGTHHCILPSLLIRGALSDYITDDDLAAFKLQFPLMKVVDIKNAGHWVQADNFSGFINEVADFLKRN